MQETLLQAWKKRSSLDAERTATLPEQATADRGDASFEAMVIQSALAELTIALAWSWPMTADEPCRRSTGNSTWPKAP